MDLTRITLHQGLPYLILLLVFTSFDRVLTFWPLILSTVRSMLDQNEVKLLSLR